jgi:nucleotide-binding universal stress UspA family protein
MRIRHILVPTDFSDGSMRAFETALVMAFDSGAVMTLLHVQHVPTSVFPDVILPVSPELMRDAEHSAELQLDEWCGRAHGAGVPCDKQITVGATHVAICETAEAIDADLIVIGTHGRGGLTHALLGSVAEKVVRKAPCPVLTVRPEMHSTFAHP